MITQAAWFQVFNQIEARSIDGLIDTVTLRVKVLLPELAQEELTKIVNQLVTEWICDFGLPTLEWVADRRTVGDNPRSIRLYRVGTTESKPVADWISEGF